MSEAAETSGTGAAAPSPGRPSLLRAYGSVGAATLFWSSNVVAVKYILEDFPAFPAALIRITLAAVTLAAIRLAQRKPFSVRTKDRGVLLQLGVAGIAWSFLLFTTALAYTSVAHAVFLGAVTPLAVLLLARLEGQERITLMKLAGLLVCLLGVVFLALDKTKGTASHWTGDLLAFAGMWCFAFFTVRSKRLAEHYDSFSLNTYAFLIAAFFCLPFLFWSFSTVPWAQVSWVGWAALLYSATFGSAGAYLTYYHSLRTLTASQVAAFQYVQPILSTGFGVAFLAETWGVGFEAGAALILVGMFLAERR
ncbi:MAG: DMT family transporter [Acidobacteria bacterium]|nr:DMT family transporter [Acidobacteriota bacterium]